MKLLIASTVLSLLASGEARAQDVRDALIVSGRLDVPHAGAGGTGSVEWLRETNTGGVQLGALSGSRGDAWWSFGRVGAFLRRPRTILSGTIEIGGGALAGARFGYRRLDGEISVPIARSRVFVETQLQLAQMAGDTRRIARAGIKAVLTKSLSAGGSYYLVAWNGTIAPAVSARVDLDRKPLSLLGGVVIARTQRTPSLVSEVTLPLTSAEIFGGCSFGHVRRIQIAASVSPPHGEANRIVASLRIPLGRRVIDREH